MIGEFASPYWPPRGTKRTLVYVVDVLPAITIVYEHGNPGNAAAGRDEAIAVQEFKNGCADQWPHRELTYIKHKGVYQSATTKGN